MKFITSSAEFKNIYNNNRRIDSKLFSLLFQNNPEAEEFSIGIIVNKRVGKAVIRNKVKRRVKYFIREHIEIIKPDYRYLIRAKPLSGLSDWVTINKELLLLFTNSQFS